MAKMKDVNKHIHSIKYSTKDEYNEDEELSLKLKAEFRIQPSKRHVFCVLRDDRLQNLIATLVRTSVLDEFDEEMDTVMPTYLNKNKIIDYTSALVDKEHNLIITGVSKCHPEDAFDIQAGKEIALAKALDRRDRVINQIKKLMDEGVNKALGNIADQLRNNVSLNREKILTIEDFPPPKQN